jgi:hypothetical protein
MIGDFEKFCLPLVISQGDMRGRWGLLLLKYGARSLLEQIVEVVGSLLQQRALSHMGLQFSYSFLRQRMTMNPILGKYAIPMKILTN